MPDQDDAEKLANAKKRYEQLKKAKAKKTTGKKDETSSKSDKKDDAAEADAEPSSPIKEKTKDKEEKSKDKEDKSKDDKSKKSKEPSSPTHGRKASVSQESRLRSASFRTSIPKDAAPALKSPTLTSPTSEAADVYRKQAARIEELEAANKKLEADVTKLEAMEEELDDLREASTDLPHLKEKAKEADKLKDEIASLTRQNAQLQSAAKSSRRESSSPEANLKAELDSKAQTIESLELEISQLTSRHQSAVNQAGDLETKIEKLEQDLKSSKAAAESSHKELEDLRANLAKASSSADDATSLSQKLAQVEAELATAKRTAKDSDERVETLEKKITALTTLHREAEARSTAKITDMGKHEREAKELRSRMGALRTENDRLKDEAARRKRLEAVADESALEELEEEERNKLQKRVRDLEAEIFELKRGAWREQRQKMQPGLDEGGFDEVDLSPSPNQGPWNSSRQQQQHSSFSDVINSGISAFTGGNQLQDNQTKRKQSVGFVEEDDLEFDEEAFAQAHKDEEMARIERVKETKRGLKKWEGWRVDIADLRAGMGHVFDV